MRLPTDYGPSTTVYNRFNRWSRRGFWLKLLDALVDARAVTKNTAIDSTYVKAQRAASVSAWTFVLHPPRERAIACAERLHRPLYALMLTAGNVGDVKAAPALLKQAGRMRFLLADKGYDADQLRRSLRDAGAVPVIPGRRSRKRAICCDKERYRGLHLIENAFCRLKDFRRVHTRYDKLAATFSGASPSPPL